VSKKETEFLRTTPRNPLLQARALWSKGCSNLVRITMPPKVKRILCIVAGFVFGAFLIYRGTVELLNSRRLADHGKPLQAKVVNKRESVSGRFRRHTYYLEIAFSAPNAVAVDKEVKVTSETFQDAEVGAQVKAFYLPENPTVCAAGETVELRYGTLVFGLLALAGGIFLWCTMNQASTVDELAAKIETHLQPLMVNKFEYRKVEAREFTHLDLSFYDNAQKELEGRGYTLLADLENLTVRSEATAPTFIRALTSSDFSTVAFLYHVKPKKPTGEEPKILDLESSFSNSQFVCTSNAAKAGAFDSPPAIDSKHLPAATAWREIIDTHEQRLTEFLSNHPGVEPIKLTSFEEVRNFQDRLQQTKADYRRQAGLSKSELQRLVGSKTEIDLNELHAAIAKRLLASRVNGGIAPRPALS